MALPVPVGIAPVGKIPVGRGLTVFEGVFTGGHGATELVGWAFEADDEGTIDEEEGATEGVEEGLIEGVPDGVAEDLTFVSKVRIQPLPDYNLLQEER